MEPKNKIKGQYNYFNQIEPNYWQGYILTTNQSFWIGKAPEIIPLSILDTDKTRDFRDNFIPVAKFTAKQHMVGFWQVWYYNTNKLVFDYEFKSLEDIVHLIDFNIRLGIKY